MGELGGHDMDRCEDVIDHRPRDDCPAKSPSLGCDFIVRPPALSKMKFLHCLCAARVGRPSSKGVICQRVQCAHTASAAGDAVQGRQITFRCSLHPSFLVLATVKGRTRPLARSPHLRIFLVSQGYSTSSTFSVEAHSFRPFRSWVIENGRSVHSARPRFVGD